MLSDAYFKNAYPQKNVLEVLDSVAKHSLFAQNGKIAVNLIEKLTEILPGSKAPQFQLELPNGEKPLTLESFQTKHLYIQFVDLDIKECEKEIELLLPMYKKFNKDITFLTVYKKRSKYTRKQEQLLTSIPWQKVELDEEASLFKNYKVLSFPSYVLIDAFGYVVAAPALKPSPNGKYETIEKSFFYIQKINEEEKK